MTVLEVVEKMRELEEAKAEAEKALQELIDDLPEARRGSEWVSGHHEKNITDTKARIDELDLMISGYKYRLQKVRMP